MGRRGTFSMLGLEHKQEFTLNRDGNLLAALLGYALDLAALEIDLRKGELCGVVTAKARMT